MLLIVGGTMPPDPAHQLTDRAALLRNHARAVGMAGADRFLIGVARAELQERLNEVNRTFTRPAIVTPGAAMWSDFLPGARMVEDCDTLDMEPQGHDIVVHAMGLHWAADPVGQLVQIRRALVPDGLFLGVMFGGQTLAELRASLAQAESDLTGGLSPRVLPMAEIRDLGGLLQRAGFALPVADSLKQTVSYPDLATLARDLRAMGESNALAARARNCPPRALFALAENLARANFPQPGNRFACSFELIFLTGWAPDASQPQPLKPGSARTSLAEALGNQSMQQGDFLNLPPKD